METISTRSKGTPFLIRTPSNKLPSDKGIIGKCKAESFRGSKTTLYLLVTLNNLVNHLVDPLNHCPEEIKGLISSTVVIHPYFVCKHYLLKRKVKQIIFEKVIVSTTYIFEKHSLKILVTIISLFIVSKVLIQQIITFKIFEKRATINLSPYVACRSFIISTSGGHSNC